MEKETRNRIQSATQDARALIEHEIAQQLEGTFDIHQDGRIAEAGGVHLGDHEHLVREKIVSVLDHKQAIGISADEAVSDYTRECAFTFVNRIAALKMMEARGIVQQCVSKGIGSSGFREFGGLAPGLSELPDKGYQLYLECLFDEIGTEVGVLFDRTDRASLLWPRKSAFDGLLDILNAADLDGIWVEDETIGWIYQYWNSKEERKAMRDASAAPRNSRELAVRNQFFTPRYVVEFLTDNTLGRIWYEMTKGQTRLAEGCRYLVRRPMEYMLPNPEGSVLPDDYEGQGEMLDFWRTGDACKLPEDPDVTVLTDWVSRLAGDRCGFEAELTLLGTSHQEVVETLIFPDGSGDFADLTAKHPVILIHCLWRLGVEIARSSYGEFRMRASEHEEAIRYWAPLLRQLREPPSDLSQEDLLLWPVFVPHRPVKDPREIRLLDPACGSMHFGLYAFDLFEAIYEEAWELQLSVVGGQWSVVR